MASRQVGEQRFWTLVADPSEYRIAEAILRLDQDWWTCGRSDIRVGDGVAIWTTRGGKGAGRGVIAFGDVVDGPVPRADLKNPFHLNPARAKETMNRVAVRYTPIQRPLWDDGEHGSLIGSLNAARSRGGTVFTLAPHQWAALHAAVFQKDDITVDEPILLSFVERKRYQQHRRIERNTTAAREVKQVRGFRCEACAFRFDDMYGDIGVEYIEAHHKRPLSSLDENSDVSFTTDDFVVLCANCHRMIHRWPDPSDVEGFTRMLRFRRKVA